MVSVEYFQELILNLAFSRFPFLNNLYIIILFLCLLILYNWYFKDKKTKWVNSHHKILSFFLVIIILLTVGLLTYEKYYFPKSSQDQLLVFISPFPSDSSENSKVDFDTAEELKKQIGNITGSSIKVKTLEPPPVTSDEEAVYRGKKVCANIVLYGEQKDKYGHITELEYHIIPINFSTAISKPTDLNMTENAKFNATFSLYSADPIVIVESLNENVSSTVNALCALESYNKSDYVSAINLFESITNYECKDSILYFIANCYNFEGNYTEAIKNYDQAIEINHNNSDAWNGKGICLFFSLNKSEEAIKALDNATEVGPNNSKAWSNKGALLFALGKYEEAIKAFDNATEIDPNDPLAWNNKGICLFYLGKHEEAIKAFDNATEIDPNDSSFWYNKGYALSRLGNYKEAIKAFDNETKIDPQNSKAWSNKGDTLVNLGNYEEAINAYNKVTKIDPQDSLAWSNKGYCLYELGKYEEAIKAFDNAIEFSPTTEIDSVSNLWFWKGSCLLFSGETEEAIKALDNATEINPLNIYAWISKGYILEYMLGNYTEAIEAYDKVIEIDPKNFKNLSKYDKEIEICRNFDAHNNSTGIENLNPDEDQKSNAWNGKGRCLDKLGNKEEAIKAYNNATEIEKQGTKKYVSNKYSENVSTWN